MPKPEVPSEMIVHASRRLRAAQIALGFRNADMAHLFGVQENTYANWVASNPTRRIPETAALRLWQIHRIPMESIYGGDLSRTEYAMATKLIAACAETMAAVGAPAPEWPMAAETALGPRTIGAIPKRPRGTKLHEPPSGFQETQAAIEPMPPSNPKPRRARQSKSQAK